MKEKGRAVCVAGIALCGLIGGASATMAQNKLCVSDINITLSNIPGNAKYNSSQSQEGYFDGQPLGIPIADCFIFGGCDTQGHCQDNSIMNISVKKRVFGIKNNSGESGCLDAVALITSDQRQTAGVPRPEKNGQAWKRIGMVEGRYTRALRVDFSQPMVTGNPFTTPVDPYTFCGDSKRDGHWACTNTFFQKEVKHGSDHSKWIVTDVFTEIDKEYNNPVDWDHNTYCAGTWTMKDGHNRRLMVKVEPYENLEAACRSVVTGYDGKWVRLSKNANGATEFEYKVGVTQGEAIAKGTEMSHAVSVAIGYESQIGGEATGGSTTKSFQIGYSFTHTQSEEITRSFEKTAEQTVKQTCDRGQVFQWSNSVIFNHDPATKRTATSSLLVCTTPDDSPPTGEEAIEWNGCDADNSSGQWRCKKSDAKKSAGSFKKDGNNGTVSCNTFCGKVKADGTPEWGTKTGACVEAINESAGESIPCDAVPGLLQDGKQLTCFCNDSFKKDGNNGTVSCNTYCGAAGADGKPVWGEKIGYCVEAIYESTGETVPCNTVPGIGKQLTCLCAPDVKIKHGDNGTVNCATYCFNYQSESHKQCVAAWNNVTKNNSDATCNHLPGLLNGPELTCTCR